jgi:cell division protein FtsI (penicillin-binding protein 3)
MRALGSFFLLLVLGCFTALAGRLVDLQYFQHAEYAALARHYLDSQIDIPFRRGAIFDARGRELAVSFARRSCAIDPQIVKKKYGSLDQTLDKLRTVLQLTPAEIDHIFQQADRDGKHFVWVKRFLNDATAAAVENLRLSGVILAPSYQRYYPQKTVAAAVLGFTDIDGRGLEGVERAGDALLRGETLTAPAWRDALGRKMTDETTAIPRNPPLNVELTLDAYVQMIAEEELDKALKQFGAPGGCAVVLNMRGDILAMAGLPGFDANNPNGAPVENRLIKGVAMAYEPGSIFKPFVVAAALEKKVVGVDDEFFCENGAWKMPGVGRVLHDTHGYGKLTTAGVLIKSSNIGVAKIAEKLGMEKLFRAIRAFGFGLPTGAPLAGEIGGKVFPLEKWTAFSRGSVPMGHEFTATPLQIAAAWCALANGGEWYQPRLIRRVFAAGGDTVAEVPPQKKRRVVSPATAQAVRSILKRTVEEGTGRHARSELYDFGGKTGTAQQAVNQQEAARGLKGYSPDRYIGSFVLIAPIDRPEIVVLVSICDPDPRRGYYGGTVAAPAVRAIAERVLTYQQVPAKKTAITLAARN